VNEGGLELSRVLARELRTADSNISIPKRTAGHPQRPVFLGRAPQVGRQIDYSICI